MYCDYSQFFFLHFLPLPPGFEAFPFSVLSFPAPTKHCQLPSVFVYFFQVPVFTATRREKETASRLFLFLLQRAPFL